MSPEQKALIKHSWLLVEPISGQASILFYNRLFEIDPKMKILFAATDMTAQRRKLIQAIATVVDGLDKLEDLVPNLEALGRKHAQYGVEPKHYDTVGAALIWTLEAGLAEHWTPKIKAAWIAAYTLIARTMQNGALNRDNVGAAFARSA